MTIRRFIDADAPALCEIFYRSVHEVASARYTPEQVNAWAPVVPDYTRWLDRLREYDTFVACGDAGFPVAWMMTSGEGYVDMLFAAPEAAGRGIVTHLYAVAEDAARARGIATLTAHASFLAQPFFLKHGWRIDAHEEIERRGVLIPRAAMSKVLV